MTVDELFIKIDKILLSIFSHLEEEESILGKKHENLQLRSDVQSGWVKRSGILVPLDSISHKLLFDSYEYHLIETFLKLIKGVYEEKDNIFTEFSFRTLIELSFYRTQIIFSNKISDNEKNKYKLLIWLADYSSMGIGRREHMQNYKKLLAEYGELFDLTRDYYKPLLDMQEALEKQDIETHPELVKKIRKMINNIQGDLYGKTEPIPIFKSKKIKYVYSGWSHILHGNTLLLSNIFSKNVRPNQHKLRVHWFMFMCGLNVATYVANYLEFTELIDKIGVTSKESEVVMSTVSKYWETIEAHGK